MTSPGRELTLVADDVWVASSRRDSTTSITIVRGANAGRPIEDARLEDPRMRASHEHLLTLTEAEADRRAAESRPRNSSG